MKMTENISILNDANPNKNWRVAAYFQNIIWIHLSAPQRDESPLGYDVSTILEFDLETNNKEEIDIHQGSFVLWDLYATNNYLYASILTDKNNDGIITDEDKMGGMKLVRYNRVTREAKELWSFTGNCFLPNIKQVLSESYILLNLTFEDENGDVFERYDVFDITSNQMQTIYIDNEDMIECNVFLTKGSGGQVFIIKDLHVTPSDKPQCGGKADRILLMR